MSSHLSATGTLPVSQGFSTSALCGWIYCRGRTVQCRMFSRIPTTFSSFQGITTKMCTDVAKSSFGGGRKWGVGEQGVGPTYMFLSNWEKERSVLQKYLCRHLAKNPGGCQKSQQFPLLQIYPQPQPTPCCSAYVHAQTCTHTRARKPHCSVENALTPLA